LGPILGGVLIDAYGPVRGVRLAFSAAIAMAFVALVAQQFLIEDDKNDPRHEAESNPLALLRGFGPSLRNLLVSDILIRFCEQIPYAYVVLWAIRDIPKFATAQVTATQFGVLTSIEMATAVVCYIPVARLADKGHKKPFVAITFANFALFPLVLYFSRSFETLVIAFIVRGLKEFGEPTRKALIMRLAPEDRKAAAFGAYYLFRDIVVAVAAAAGALLWSVSPAANFLTAFGFGVLGTIWFIFYGREQEIV
jgi:MFS family permease